jgi:uncharacterized radical SAM superfamily Fe-S cluster-containing enzyme
MTITIKEARELKKRITKLVNAEVAHSWKGSDRAEAFTDYDEELRIARKRLNECIENLKLPDGRIEP